jgi:diguanylate cyclase (GGDEF)-like protein/PAS domain S-box-containing protein
MAELWNNPLLGLIGHIVVAIGLIGVLWRVNRRSQVSVAREQDSRRQIAEILESITDGFVAIDRQYRFTYVNAEGEKLLGKRREEMVGRICWDVIPDMEGSVFHRNYMRAMEQREPVVFVEHSLVVDKWFSVHAYPSASGISVYFRDVTAERRAQAALKTSEERYRELFENANDLLYTHDLLGNFTSVNHACVTVTGYTHEELQRMNLADLVAPEHLDRARQMLMQKVQQGGGATTYELEIIARDGRRVPVEVSTRLVLENSYPVAVTGMARDISERKRAEAALLNMSLTDALTGVYNRRGAMTVADQQIKMAQRLGRGLLLLYADVNHLKQINDTYGHTAGDRALKEVAQILRETFRESDIVARLGGDEFLIMAMESDASTEETLRRRLADKLAIRNTARDVQFILTVSLGVARLDPDRARPFEELLVEADERMYGEKRKATLRLSTDPPSGYASA